MHLSDRALTLLEGQIFTEHDVREMLESFGSQTEAADVTGISRMHINLFLHGKRGLGEEAAAKLGLRRVVVYVK